MGRVGAFEGGRSAPVGSFSVGSPDTGPISGSVDRRRPRDAVNAGLVVGARLRSGRGRPRAKSRVWGYEPCRAACPVEGLESRAPLAAATPFLAPGALACQSATS